MADISAPGLTVRVPVLGDKIPYVRASTGLLDSNADPTSLGLALGPYTSVALLQTAFPAATNIGKHATGPNGVDYVSDGVQWYAVGTGPVRTAAIATGVLPLSSLGAVTPVNAAGAVVLTLPDAATSFAAMPYGLVVLSQKGAGAPTFAPAGTDSLRATSGIAASVQYGMIAAQIISATEWALA